MPINYGTNDVSSSGNISSSGTITATSGVFANLSVQNGISVNNTGVSISGHSHATSDITDFNSSVSGLVSGIYQPLLTSPVVGIGSINKIPKWASSSGLTDSIITESASVLQISGSIRGMSDDTYLSFDSSTNRVGITKKNGFFSKLTYGSGAEFAISQSNAADILPTGTFTDRFIITSNGTIRLPGLTNNGFLKTGSSNGTVSVDTTSYQPLLSNPVTGTGISNHIAYWNSSSNIVSDSGQLYWDSTNNRLGIGTNAPISSLDTTGGVKIGGWSDEIPGSGKELVISSISSPSGALNYSNAGIIFQHNGLNTVYIRSNPTNFRIGNNLGDALTVTHNTHNIGIGTTTPSAKLHVIGTGVFSNVGATSVITIDPDGRSIDCNPSNSFNDINIKTNGQNIFRGLDNWTGTWNDAVSTTYYQVGRSAGNTFFTSFLGNAFNRLAYSANKILFTNNTSNLLTPSGYLTIRANIDGGSFGTSGLVIDTTHSSASANGQSHGALVLTPLFNTVGSNLNNIYGAYIAPRHSGVYTTTNSYALYVNATNNITGTVTNNYAAVFDGGNVGIRTATPSGQLHVIGTGLFSQRVGIGTNSPSYILDVTGTGNFTQNLLVNGTGVSLSGHKHVAYIEIQEALLEDPPSALADIGAAPLSHTHISADITNFSSGVNSLVSGTYAPLTGTLNQFASTSSSQLATVINDETGTGLLVFNTSPAFSGIPTVPTATSGTNTTQVASTAFVRTEITNLIASAPSTLDTLNELAAALGNDANFSTTITNSLASKANLSGATFTGAINGPSGDFTVLRQNGVNVSTSGHLHTSSNISDFNSSVSGLFPGSANEILYKNASGILQGSGALTYVDTSNFLIMKKFSDDIGAPVLQLFKSRGSSSSPIIANTGDILGQIQFRTPNFNLTERVSSSIVAYIENSGSSSGVNASSYLTFNTSPGGGAPGLNPLERLRITGSGRVGIGHNSPSGGVHIKNDGGQWSSFNYSPSILIDGTRNNGIGFLDSSSSNPMAIVNNGGRLVFASMPSPGDTGVAPSPHFTITNTGTAVIGSTALAEASGKFGVINGSSYLYACDAAYGTLALGPRKANDGYSTILVYPTGSKFGGGAKYWTHDYSNGAYSTTYNDMVNPVLTLMSLTTAGNLAVTGSITASGNVRGDVLVSSFSSGSEGGEIQLSKSVSANSISGSNIIIDSFENKIRFFEQGSPNRGYFLDITQGSGSAGLNLRTKAFGHFSASDNMPPATSYATLDTRNSIMVLDFDATTTEYAIFPGVIPDNANLASGLRVNINWMATTATTGNCVWQAEFKDMDDDLDAITWGTPVTGISTTNITNGTPTITAINLSSAQIDAMVPGDFFLLRIARSGASASDTMPGDAELINLEVETIS